MGKWPVTLSRSQILLGLLGDQKDGQKKKISPIFSFGRKAFLSSMGNPVEAMWTLIPREPAGLPGGAVEGHGRW